MKPNRPSLRATLLAAALACTLPHTSGPVASAQQSNTTRDSTSGAKPKDDKGVPAKLYAKSYALVIGVSDYTPGWSKLAGAERDVAAVSAALERQGFKVTRVLNPDSAQLRSAFEEFIELHGMEESNRLLFYFAGHGHTVKNPDGSETGYIVPADAPRPEADPAGFASKALEMERVQFYARRIRSRHALFLFDGPFAGTALDPSEYTMFGYRGGYGVATGPGQISRMGEPVRQFIVSGGAGDRVPMESIFRRQLVEAIAGEADINYDGYVTGTELGEFLRDKVSLYSRDSQRPQYGKLRAGGLDEGEFVFAPRADAPAPNSLSPTPTPASSASSASELAFWEAIKNSPDPNDYRDYLQRFPDGRFAAIARVRLNPATTPSAPTGGGVVEVERYPNMAAPSEVEVGVRFAVEVSLTVEEPLRESLAEVEPSGGRPRGPTVALDLPNQEQWEVTVNLIAPGFRFESGTSNSSAILLPRSGDSTPAAFYLIADETGAARRERPVSATLWHKGSYLAKITRKVVVTNPRLVTQSRPAPAAPSSARPRGAAGNPLAPSPASGGSLFPAAPAPAADESVATHKQRRVRVADAKGEAVPDLTIYLMKAGGGPGKATLDLTSPHKGFPRAEMTLDADFHRVLADAYRTFSRLGSRDISADGGKTVSARAEAEARMKEFGRQLFRKTPKTFQDAFWELSDKYGSKFKTIQIYTDDPSFPWELMRPVRDGGKVERDYLGVEFSVGRWHIPPDDSSYDKPPRPFVLDGLTVIAPDYTGVEVLPGQKRELSALESFYGYRRVPGVLAKMKALAENLPQGIVHFAGHGSLNPSPEQINRFAIRLEDGDLDAGLWASWMVRRDGGNSPLFFFNACEVGQAQLVSTFINGWAPAVIEKGATGYVGALWPVGDRGAAEFSARFYRLLRESLQGGRPTFLAEVLRKTRESFSASGDPMFMAYVFYGDSNLEVILGPQK